MKGMCEDGDESSAGVYSDGDYFASIVSLYAGANIINAVSTGYDGVQKVSSVSMSASGNPAKVSISALTPQLGVIGSPDDDSTAHLVTFSASVDSAIANSITSYSWDVDGDGRVEIECSNPVEPGASYSKAGIYLPTLKATASDGNEYESGTIVQVITAGDVSGEIVALWEAMKASLASKDIESALAYFTEDYRDYYRSVYTELYESLPQIVSEMRDIELIYLKDSAAKYRIKKAETLANGSVVEVTYYVYFLKGEDGLWKIYLY